jgi:hypothetical protein
MSTESVSLEEKLERLYNEATPEEQETLTALLLLAANAKRDAGTDEVEGFQFSPDTLTDLQLQNLMDRYGQPQRWWATSSRSTATHRTRSSRTFDEELAVARRHRGAGTPRNSGRAD